MSLIPAGSSVLRAQTVTESAKSERQAFPPDRSYFSLAHHGFNAMSAADRALGASRKEEIRESALVYGYDLGGYNLRAGNWKIEQGACPLLPDTLLLHYLERYPDGTQSLFTALVPRSSGRVRIVPVLHRNAVPFLTAAANPKNYELFNSLVSSETARRNSVPGGDWLSMGVCYAEMVGGRPNVPRDPSVDKATFQAVAATIYVDPATGRRNIRFPDREANHVVKVWSILLDPQGRIVDAGYEDNSTYVAHVVQPAADAAKTAPAPSKSAAKAAPAIADPPTRIVTTAPDPPSRIITHIPDPPVKITPVPPGQE